MNATELYKAGKLQDAVAAQTQEVKSAPADQGKRLFLFELLAFAGELDRATRQIDAIKYDQIDLQTATTAYRRLVDSEAKRRRLFSEGLKPEFFAEVPEHVTLRLDAVNCLRDNKLAEAKALLDRAAAVMPRLKGQLNDKPFESLRDGDDLFAGVLEVMAHGVYYWVPLEQVEGLSMKAPRFPRDLLWVPARLEMETSAGDIFIPALYPNSHAHSDDLVKLGRSTDWKETPEGPVLGTGLRTFLVGEDAISILEWRNLQIPKS
jgi:type VI secretion system protein ImpE